MAWSTIALLRRALNRNETNACRPRRRRGSTQLRDPTLQAFLPPANWSARCTNSGALFHQPLESIKVGLDHLAVTVEVLVA